MRRGVVAGAVAAIAVAVGFVVAGGSGPDGPCANGYVALTFDDGPSATSDELLKALREHGLRATMFVTAQNAERNPDAVRGQAEAGLWIENHTVTHPDLTRLDDRALTREITEAQRTITRLTGRRPTLFRPPFLDTDTRVRDRAERLGLREVLVTEDARDYANASPAEIVEAAERLEPGGILLMHDWPRATIEAVPGIAAALTRNGLCSGRIEPGGEPVDSPGTDATFRARAVAP